MTAHQWTVLAVAFLSAFIAGVAVTAVVIWWRRDQFRAWALRNRDRLP